MSARRLPTPDDDDEQCRRAIEDMPALCRSIESLLVDIGCAGKRKFLETTKGEREEIGGALDRITELAGALRLKYAEHAGQPDAMN